MLSKLISAVAFLASIASAAADRVAWDSFYGTGSNSLDSVACSNGNNGIITKYGYTTLGSIPNFPHVGAAQAVTGWNSPNCGSCWQLTYNGKSIYVVAVDVSTNGFVISPAAITDLGGPDATAEGVLQASATEVEYSYCHLPHA